MSTNITSQVDEMHRNATAFKNKEHITDEMKLNTTRNLSRIPGPNVKNDAETISISDGREAHNKQTNKATETISILDGRETHNKQTNKEDVTVEGDQARNPNGASASA